jgi:hypothetical protein
MKFVGMGAQPDGINLLFSLVVEPGFNHVAGEHIAAQQERVITFERVKRLVEWKTKIGPGRRGSG